MGKTNLRLSAFAGLLGLAVAGAFTGSGAHAQTGWSGEASRNEPEAKRTPPPPPVQIPGSWDGPIQDSKAGTGSINLTFTETAGKARAALRGTWAISYPDTAPEGAINDVGKLTGSVVGNSVAMILSPRKGDALGNCRIIFNAVDATQQMISGNYHFGVCGGTNTGTISVQPGHHRLRFHKRRR